MKRTLSYKSLLDGYLRRKGHGLASAASADDLVDAAEFATSAYRHVLEAYPWPEAMVPATLSLTAGLVPWVAVAGADWYRFWSADPDTTPGAYRLRVLRVDSAGIQLEPTLTSCWVSYAPRAPQFTSVTVTPKSTYQADEVVYNPADGHSYVALTTALGSELADVTKWRAQPILWSLSEPTKLCMLADSLGNSDHERAQAAQLQQQAEAMMADTITRQERPH